MPTLLPRLQVTMTVEQHKLLAELASLCGKSSAGFLRQMIDAATPLLRYTVDEARHVEPDDIPDLGRLFHHAFDDIVHQLGETGYLQQLDFEEWAARNYPASSDGPAANDSERGTIARGISIDLTRSEKGGD